MNVVQILGSFFKGVMEGMGIDTQTVQQFISDLATIGGAAFKGLSSAINAAWGVIQPVLNFLAEALGKLIGLLAKVTFEPLQKGASFLSGLLGGGNKPKRALGDNNFMGGATTISEQGKEMFATPSGLIGISPNSRSEMFLPKGTQIFSNKKTEKIINMAKNIFNNQMPMPQGGNSYEISIPINIQQVAQDKIEKIKDKTENQKKKYLPRRPARRDKWLLCNNITSITEEHSIERIILSGHVNKTLKGA